MAELKYLAHINLNQNQLQNAAMQILSSDPSGFEGHLYYNSSSNVLKFHNGTEYISLSSASGDITGVTLSGDSGSASDTSANVDLTIAGGTGITTSATGTTVTATIDAAQTGITSLLATDIKIGEDDQTKIDFETANEIHFYANNVEQVYLGDNIFGPQSDSDVDLGSSSVRWKDAYVDSITVTGEVDGASLDISGDADIDGTLEADAITVGGTALNTVIAGVTVTNATNAAHVLITDNESTDEENQITFIEGAAGGTANRGLEADGDFTYNPSSGTVTATIFKGNIDAVDGDFDGTLEADAITIGGTNLLSEGMEFTGNTVFSGNPSFSGTPSVSGTLSVAGNIVHTGDTNCLIGFSTDAIKFQTGGTSRANVSDSGFQIGSGARVTTIEDNDSLGTSDTKLATQGNVKAYVDARTGTNITSLGTISQDTVVFTSSNANDPEVQIKNTTNDASGARLTFIKDKGAAGADGDDVGVITFTADDAAQTLTDYGKLLVEVGEADNTDEAGKMSLQVASSDGTTTGLTSGLVLTGHKTSDYVDVTLGSGSSSTVTIPGNLTVSGTTTTVNSTTVNLNDHNIVLDSGNSTSAVVNGAGITIEGGSGDDATFTYNTTGPKFELKLGSSYEDLQLDQLIAASLDISGNVDVDGTLETDALSINGTTVSSTAAELNLLDGSEGGTVVNNKAVIYDGNGVVNATTLAIGGTSITATAAEINKLDGVTASTDELNIIDGVTATTAEINLIDGGTSRGTTAVANGDGFLHNDGGTMRMTNVSKLADLFAGTNISASSSVLSVADAADDTKGVVELATTAEALAGSDTSRAVTPAGLAARSHVATIGDGSDDDIAITHNLGTRNVIVQMFDASSYETVIAEVVRTDANTVTINTNSGSTIASSDVTVLITKID
jgi:cytoskeletal protein CcmA (bactofilin family)